MKILGVNKRFVLATGFGALSLILVGCGSDGVAVSDLRVIHASKDAPPVNVRVDNKNVITELDYTESSGYLKVNSGFKAVAVEAIIPGGNLDVITVPSIQLEPNKRYNILAINETATIKPLVVAESAATPSATEVAIAVVHAATAAGSVDVYVTAPGADLNAVSANFNFSYEGVVDAGALPAATYQIRVTGAGSKAAVYDSGPINLSGFAGQKLLIAALSSTNATEIEASPVKLIAVADTARLVLLDEATKIGARVVHLSPDAGAAAAGPVEVFATSTALPGTVELIDAFSYTEQFPGTNAYANVPKGDYVFDVAPNTNTIGDKVLTSPSLALTAGIEYTVIAAGNVGGSPAFSLLATGDNNRAIATQVSIKVAHAAALAGSVDVFVTAAGAFTTAQVESGAAGAPLLDGFTFSSISDYVTVAPGSYDIRAVPESSGITAINVTGFAVTAGQVATVIARQPDNDGTPADFGLVVLTN